MTSLDTSQRLEPHKVAEETYVIPWVLEAPPVGYFPMNSMVIRGSEPAIIDTGAPACRAEWLSAAWEVVDPADVRWVFLSHDDRDHSGNLLQVLEACPNATLLTTWFSVGRMFEEWATPLPRVRFLNDGDTIDIGDRTMVAKRPPVYDNPTSRALLDTKTRVYWSVDTFATNMAKPLVESAEMTDAEFREGQQFGNRLIAPWHEHLDPAKWAACVNETERLGIEVIAGCHTPVIRNARVSEALGVVRDLPTAEAWHDYTQADLEMWMSMAVPEQAGPPDA